PQAVSRAGGDNKANYENPAFDKLFEQMKNMENGPERAALIDRMLELVREDAPWVFGFHPVDFALSHRWVGNMKPNQMARNGLKFVKLDPWVRAQQRATWNRPVQWPIAAGAVLFGLIALIGWRVYRRRETHVPMPDAAPVGRPYGTRPPVKSGRM
ncbi:MAG: peptide ABC transporter substrate-binding protein, partial [Burkholderiales bacterium]